MNKAHVDLVFQIGICVKDAKATLENWKRYFDIDESTIIHRNLQELYDEGLFNPGEYRGKPLTSFHELYRFTLGNMDMEIIQPLSLEPGSPYADFLIENGGNGIHHIAVKFRDRDALIENMETAGIPIYSFASQGKPFADGRKKDNYFYDMREMFGVIIEAGSLVVGPMANDPLADNPPDYDDKGRA